MDWLRAGRSGDQIPVVARFFAPVQTGPGAHPASCTMSTGSFPGVKSGWGVMLTPHPFQCRGQRKGRAIPLLPLRAVRPVQSLSACTRVHQLCCWAVFISYCTFLHHCCLVVAVKANAKDRDLKAWVFWIHIQQNKYRNKIKQKSVN